MPLPPLLQAVSEGKLADVRRLLSSGARADARDESGRTALHHAVGYGDMPGIHHPMGRAPVREVIDALLKAGAPLNAQDRSGATALMAAISANHEDAARWLAEGGADLRLKDKSGGSALTRALWYRRSSREFVAFLRQKGAPVNLWDALWLGDEPLALRLAERADPKAIGPNQFTYLHLASLLGSVKVAKLLLAHKANIQARADEGWTPLHLACGGIPQNAIPSMTTHWTKYGPAAGREELVQLLLSAKANLYARDDDRRLPRDWAAGLKRPELAALLVRSTGRRT